MSHFALYFGEMRQSNLLQKIACACEGVLAVTLRQGVIIHLTLIKGVIFPQ